MSAHGDWIEFAELVTRSGKKARTLRRMIAEKQISSRQRVRGGKRDFNWKTVARELALLEDRSAQADRHEAMVATDLQQQINDLHRLVRSMAIKMGVAA